MKINGELTVPAPQAAVFDAVQDARFFASCIDGVQELTEVDPTHYDAVLETKVAYMKFRFKLSVEVTRKEPPDTIEAKVEGTPLGIVGRITATSLTRLSQVGDETKIAYEIDAAITGKLGSLGQPVLKSKAKDMEKQFASRLREKFSPASSGAAS
jgi:carbon monoxide dehydrogenase subunit G